MWGDSLGFLLGEAAARWSERSLRLEGEKETVAEIFVGDGVDDDEGTGLDFGFGGGGGEGLGLGAKNREITCCFCLPIVTITKRL